MVLDWPSNKTWERPEQPYLSALFAAQDKNNIVLVILAYPNYLMSAQT